MSIKKIDMTEALDLLGFEFPRGKENFNILCPFCSSVHKSKRKTMNINLAKGEGGVYSCLRCNSQGHVITFWKNVKGFSSNKEAAKDIRSDVTSFKPVKRVQKRYVEKPIANVDTRAKTYDAFLDTLVLTDAHRKELLSRGLSNKFIDAHKYRSIPQTRHREIATVLLDQGLLLDNVPGFFKEHGEWEVSHYGSGIIIPQRDGFGRIQGFQMRMDNEKFGKYLNFTSASYPGGTATKAYVHLSFNKRNTMDNIILTEGALKADAITYFTDISTLSIPGVNSVRFLPQALYNLKEKGLKKISIAFDMDSDDNPNVYKALCNLKNLIRDADIPFCVYKWDRAYKGLDDYLKAHP